MRFRVSLATMLAIIGVAGVGLAALKSASGYWASASVTIALVVLLTAVLGAVLGRSRAWWLGFSTFGWAYFVLAFGPWFQDDLRPHLMTSVVIADSYRFLHDPTSKVFVVGSSLRYGEKPEESIPSSYSVRAGPHEYVTVAGIGPAYMAPGFPQRPFNDYIVWGRPIFYAYERSSHALFSLLFGLIGGVVAKVFDARHRVAPRPIEATA